MVAGQDMNNSNEHSSLDFDTTNVAVKNPILSPIIASNTQINPTIHRSIPPLEVISSTIIPEMVTSDDDNSVSETSIFNNSEVLSNEQQSDDHAQVKSSDTVPDLTTSDENVNKDTGTIEEQLNAM